MARSYAPPPALDNNPGTTPPLRQSPSWFLFSWLIGSPLRRKLDQVLNPLLFYLNPITHLSPLIVYLHRSLTSTQTHRSILALLILILLFSLSLILSVLGYLTFYWSYVPQIGFRAPLWLQYGEGRAPYATIDFASHPPQITVDQTYDVTLHLTVPTNERNLELGNFMVRLALVSAPPHNTTLHRSSRHASLVYQPAFARNLQAFKHIRTLFFFSPPPSLQRIKVPLLERRVLQPSSLTKKVRLGHARLDIGRHDVYTSPSPLLDSLRWGELQVYEASLVFDAHLEGLRWALYYHPYICFCVFSVVFLFIEFATVIFTWGLILHRAASLERSESDHDAIKYEEQDEQKPDPNKPGPSTAGYDSSLSDDALQHQTPSDSDDPGTEPWSPTDPTIKLESEDPDGVLLDSSELTGTSRSTGLSHPAGPRDSVLVSRATRT